MTSKATKSGWKATHRVYYPTNRRHGRVVMLCDDRLCDVNGAHNPFESAFTYGEWRTESAADLCLNSETGEWFFMGQPFAGRVVKIKKA
jgi:hypothetical protein